MFTTLAALVTLSTPILVDRGDYTIHAEKLGTGTPMVILPGGPGFSGKAVWAIAFGTRSNITSYLFDQLGTGKSHPKIPNQDPTNLISLNKTIEDIESIRKSEKHDKWIVCGQSWGAIVALVYAARYPDRVHHLILTSIPGIGYDATILGTNLNRAIPEPLSKQLVEIELNTTLSPEEKVSAQLQLITPYYFFSHQSGDYYLSLAPAELFEPKVFISLQKHILNSADYYDDLTKLPKTKFPVTLIQGHQDPTGAAMPYLLKEQFLPRAKVNMINQAGHFPWIENSDAFFTAFYADLGIKPPAFVTEYEDEDVMQKENDARTKNGWPFNYIPPAVNSKN